MEIPARKTTSHQLARGNCRPKSRQVLTIDGEEYRLGGRLGDGAAGVVRKAIRVADKEPRAVKFLAPDPKYIDESVFDDVAARFKREGERGAGIDHPHLVRIYAYEENRSGEAFQVAGAPTNPFICMECVDGKPLESYIKGLPSAERGEFLPERERLQIAIQIARALEYLHKKKVVHRDIKPANIFLTATGNDSVPWKAKLGDYGVVKWGDFHASIATGTLTVTSQQGLGTMKYMPPEQAISPKTVTVRADIFSLGITLLELFTGRLLPSVHHVLGVMHARMTQRTTTTARFKQIGYDLPVQASALGELLLDMHLRGAGGRPAISRVLGHLEFEYFQIFAEDAPKHMGG